MAMFKISAIKSPVVFSNDSRNHHISVVVNGSVLSSEDDARNGKNDANRNGVNKGRALIKSSEDSMETGASSRIYLGGLPAAAGSACSSVATAGTTSIRVSEVINRENQDRAESRVSISNLDSSQKHHPRPSASSSDFILASHPVRGFSREETEEEDSSLQPQRSNRFPLVHQSRFDEETDGPRLEGSSSSIRIVNCGGLVSVSPTPVITMVPGAPNHERRNTDESDGSLKGGDSIEKGEDSSEPASGAQIKLSSYVSLGSDSTEDEWLKNEVNLVPKEDSIRDHAVTIRNGCTADVVAPPNRDNGNTVVSDSNEDFTVVSEESDVLAEGIKLRVSFGSREVDEMVSRSPDDGYHDDDTMSEEESTGHPVVINETVPSANDGIHVAIPVRLSDSATTNYDREMRFIKANHVRHDSDVFDDDANSSLGSETGTILSRRGTIRGMRNHVRSSIAAFLENMATKRQYSKEENGRVVLYTTSMGVVRRTHDLCRRARNIMYTLMARFEERDVFMNRLFQQEVCERLRLDQVIVPQLFVDGVHIGNADVIERLNETGELRKLLEPYKRQSVGTVCQMCGDFRFLPCTTCGGSKKSLQHRHQFSEEIVALRCMVCDENGLIRCGVCLNDDQS